MNFKHTFKATAVALSITMLSLVTTPVRAQDAGLVVAAIAAFQTALFSFIQETVLTNLMGDAGRSAGAIKAQIAADTIGIQNALQHHAGATIQAVAQQTAIMTDQENMIEFGDMGDLMLHTGQRISTSATAPSACKRKTAAAALSLARQGRPTRMYNMRISAQNHTARIRSSTTSAALVANAKPPEMALTWLAADALTADEVGFAVKSISNIVDPAPLATLIRETSPEAQLYKAQRTVHNARVAVIQQGLERQLEMRSPLAGGPANQTPTSVMSTLSDWQIGTVEDLLYPEKVQAKTSPVAAKEAVFLASANLYVAVELLKEMQQLNAVMAIDAAEKMSGVNRESADLAYKGAIIGDDQ